MQSYDDPNTGGEPNLDGFKGHRHDQALLTLCCLRDGVRGLRVGAEHPGVDTRNPSAMADLAFGTGGACVGIAGRSLAVLAGCLGAMESTIRKRIRFGHQYD
jgi:hypothetical protein